MIVINNWRAEFECGHCVVLGLCSGAVFRGLLVYVWTGWRDMSIYASPFWLLHHKITYASFCTRIGPTGYKPGHIILFEVTHRDLGRIRTFRWDVAWWAVECNWRHWHSHRYDDFYRHIDCNVQKVELHTMVSGDGTSLQAETGVRYSHGGGFATRGSGGECQHNRVIGTSGDCHRMGKTTYYCTIDDPAQHGATTRGIIPGYYRSADTLRIADDDKHSIVDVQCLSDLGDAYRDNTGGLWRSWHFCPADRPEGKWLQCLFRMIVVQCDKDVAKDDWPGACVSPPVQYTKEWWSAVLSRIDDAQKCDRNS